MRYMVNLDATSGALGKNVAKGKSWEKKNYNRRLVAVCLVGGSVATDSEIEIYFGNEKIALVKNFFTSGLDKLHWYWVSSRLQCFAGTPVICKVTDAIPAAAVLGLEFKRVTNRRRGYRRY